MSKVTPPPYSEQTSDKAWVGALSFIITYGIMQFFMNWGLENLANNVLLNEAISVVVSAGVGGLAVHLKANRPKTDKHYYCHPFAVAAALALLAGGCTVSAEEVDRKAFTEFALSQVRLYNQLGIDPLKMSDRNLAFGAAICGTVVGASAFFESEALPDEEEILDYCEILLAVAAPAAPPVDPDA